MKLALLFRRILCLAVILSLLALPLVAMAGDADPNGDKLRALHKDPKFQEALKAKQAKSNGKWETICAVEGATAVGGIIWGNRALLDPCKKYHNGHMFAYCITHSKYCDHYHWKANCLKEKGCPDLIEPY